MATNTSDGKAAGGCGRYSPPGQNSHTRAATASRTLAQCSMKGDFMNFSKPLVGAQ